MTIQDKTPAFSTDVFVVEIDGAKARTLRAFYPRISKPLLFPDYFGKNLDALFDCLCSLEVVGRNEVALVVKNAAQFLSKESESKRKAALDVLKEAQKTENRYDGVVFKVYLIR